jgi:tetraacyldisaccharide 4'-kinase
MAVAGWQARLQAVWWRTAPPPPCGLRWLSVLFGSAVARRRAAFLDGRRPVHRLGVPVIVVGNRIVGGAGKTPTTLALLQALQQAGWRPGVVSRGHGRRGDGVLEVDPAAAAGQTGDEPLLIARRTGVPVWIGQDRAAAARALLHARPQVDVIVCDDGLQHLALGRDLELIVFDDRGAGNGHLLPAGPLREPIDAPSTAPHRWVLYNAAAPSTLLPGAVARRSLAPPQPLADWRAGTAAPAADWVAWQDRPAWALAGIGAPERFFADLRRAGVPLPAAHTLPLPDHADFATLPWPATVRDLLVTEKDAVKLDPARLAAERPATRVWVVPLRYALPATLVDEVLQALAAVPRAAAPAR